MSATTREGPLRELAEQVAAATLDPEAWAAVDRLAKELGVDDEGVAALARAHGPRAESQWRRHERLKTSTRQGQPTSLVRVSAADALHAWEREGVAALATFPRAVVEELGAALDAVRADDGTQLDMEEADAPPAASLAERILVLLRKAGAAGLRKGEIIDAFNRNIPARRLNSALAELALDDVATVEKEPTAGRWAERWRAIPVCDDEESGRARLFCILPSSCFCLTT